MRTRRYSKPPGASTDIAPEWLVTEASAYAQSEFKRTERVKKLQWWSQGGKGGGKGKGKEKGKWKGKNKGGNGGAGDAAGAATPQY